MADDLSELEIAVLCDLLDGPGANLKGYKITVLDQLVAEKLRGKLTNAAFDASETDLSAFIGARSNIKPHLADLT